MNRRLVNRQTHAVRTYIIEPVPDYICVTRMNGIHLVAGNSQMTDINVHLTGMLNFLYCIIVLLQCIPDPVQTGILSIAGCIT